MRDCRVLTLAGVLLWCCGWVIQAEPASPRREGDLVDEEAAAAIRAATTDPRFLTGWVQTLPDHPEVPSPREVLGYTIGTPGELSGVDEIHGYFRALDEKSPRIRVFPLGLSFEGREMIVAAIADAKTLEALERYRGYLAELADPRATSEGRAAEVVALAKPVYWVTGGLHSPELGPPEMLMELAYRLVVEERPPFDEIRANVITLVTPVLETDGRARQVDWFRRHLKGRRDFDDLPPRSAPFWGHYVYHDNNRDGISISQPLTRNYVEGVYHWRPTISLDLHESVPLLYVAGGTGPYNRDVSPITIGEWQALASYELSRLRGFGLPGVWTWGYYTGWYPGYMLWTTNNHNSMGRFFETFGNGSAETMERDLKDVKFAGKEVTSRQWYRASPPPRKITWSMRNNVNYMESGVIASLEMVARNGSMFLANFYRKGVEALTSGREDSPHGFLIPREQRDPEGLEFLIGVLRRHAIEIRVSEGAANYGDAEVAKGDLLVLTEQPYGPLARNLLSRQEFPEKVDVPPYDDVAWSLGLMMGVDVKPIDDAAVLAHRSRLLGPTEAVVARNAVPRAGAYWVIPHRGQRELGPVRFALGDAAVQIAEAKFEASGKTFPAGSLIIDMKQERSDRIRAVLAQSLLPVTRLSRRPDVAMHEADLPRIALFQTWTSTQNAGWVRYSLDDAGVPYTLISKDRVRAGELRRDFDLILIPHMSAGTTLAQIIGGIDRKWSPLAYTATREYPNMGRILSSEDITGGMGFIGMAELEEFVRDGGTMVTFGTAGLIPADSGMLHDIVVKRPATLSTPGSVLTAKVTDRNSPLTYGYDEVTHLFRGNGPIFGVADHDRHLAVLQFGTRDWDASDDESRERREAKEKGPPLVLSGGIVSGKEKIDGEPALVHTSLGSGRVVMFSWNPMHRDVNHHDHAFVYNALMNWNDLPAQVRSGD